MYKFLCMVIFFSSSSLFACELVLYDTILIPTNVQDIRGFIKKTNCTLEQNDKILNFIKSKSGKINTHLISKYISSTGSIDIYPSTVEVMFIENMLQDQIPDNYNIENITNPNKHPIYWDNSSIVTAKCKQCFGLGRTTIELIIQDKTYWLNGELSKYIDALVAIRNLNYNDNISKSDFVERRIKISKNLNLISKLDKLDFYKLRKAVKKDEALGFNDLTPIQLTQPRKRVKVVFKQNLISIKSYGVAQGYGGYGDEILVLNPKSMKKFSAKIIDFNTVTVEL